MKWYNFVGVWLLSHLVSCKPTNTNKFVRNVGNRFTSDRKSNLGIEVLSKEKGGTAISNRETYLWRRPADVAPDSNEREFEVTRCWPPEWRRWIVRRSWQSTQRLSSTITRSTKTSNDSLIVYVCYQTFRLVLSSRSRVFFRYSPKKLHLIKRWIDFSQVAALAPRYHWFFDHSVEKDGPRSSLLTW